MDFYEFRSEMETLQQQGKIKQSIFILLQNFIQNPHVIGCLDLLANAYRLDGQNEMAIKCWNVLNECIPSEPQGFNSVAVTQFDCQDLINAFINYEKALANLQQGSNSEGKGWSCNTVPPEEMDSTIGQIELNASFICFWGGNYKRGWELWESGFAGKQRSPDRQIADVCFKNPSVSCIKEQNNFVKFLTPEDLLEPEILRDKTILVYREQGLGDEYLFASCFNDLIPYCKKVILEVDPRCIELFQESFPQCLVREPQTNENNEELEQIKDYEYCIPAATLGALFRTTPESFPKENLFIKPKKEVINYFKNKLLELPQDPEGSRLNVGIVWRSMNITPDRYAQYTSLKMWEPIFQVKGINWINIQYMYLDEELQKTEERFGIKIHNFSELDLTNNQHGLAALIFCLDLVIGCNNATTCLANAVGTPLFQLSRQGEPFSMGFPLTSNKQSNLSCDYQTKFGLSQCDYPWFPTTKFMFRKKWNETWDEPIKQTAKALTQLKGNPNKVW